MRDTGLVNPAADYTSQQMHARKGMRFLLLISVCCFLQAQTQTPPPKNTLENTGKPMKVTADCKAEEVLVLGLTCSQDDPCPLFLELSDVELVNDRLFVSGNLHTGPATLESILLMSPDLGKTWTEPVDRIPGAGWMRSSSSTSRPGG